MACKCGGSCGPCSGLGQYPPLPGHAIPYHLNTAEIQQFLSTHHEDAALQVYLESGLPAWGIIVQDAYGQLLVWFDASHILHVVDVTNLSIAHQVQQQMYESPDSSLLENLQRSFADLFSGVQTVGALLGVVALAILIYKVAR